MSGPRVEREGLIMNGQGGGCAVVRGPVCCAGEWGCGRRIEWAGVEEFGCPVGHGHAGRDVHAIEISVDQLVGGRGAHRPCVVKHSALKQ